MKRSLQRSRHKWDDSIKEISSDNVNWIEQAHDRCPVAGFCGAITTKRAGVSWSDQELPAAEGRLHCDIS